MKDLHTQKGFTLVELAIVLTIVGLLIGGILKGQELLQNARVATTIAQVRSYEAATTTFRDKYDAMPGDMANASARLTGCLPAGTGTACNPSATAGAGFSVPGDGIIGRANYTGTWTSQTTTSTATTAPANTAAISFETSLYWTHLLLANLISGVTNVTISTAGRQAAFSDSHPAAKVGGGFIIGHADGSTVTPGNPVAGSALNGPILVLAATPLTGTVAGMTGTGTQPLTPASAAQIDRKMDDGLPGTGAVQAYGRANSCFGAAAPFVYQEAVTASDCGLVFRIQG